MASSSSAPNKKLLEIFDCPICMNFMYPPIYQCSNGHRICLDCKEKVRNSCPSCREEIGSRKCVALIEVADTILFPCKYQIKGCGINLKYDEKKRHEENDCSYRPYQCPFPSRDRCTFMGDVETLVEHLEVTHKCDVYNSDEIELTFLYLCPPELTVYKCHSQCFCLQLENPYKDTKADLVRIHVTFMGTEVEARKFQYRLNIQEEYETWNISWEETPTSIRLKEITDDARLTRKLILENFNLSNTYDVSSKTLRGRIYRAEELLIRL